MRAYVLAPLLLSAMTLSEAQAATAVERTQAALTRIAALDAQGPALRAVLETNPDALAIAAALDAEAPRGPLHGMPVLIKDNIDTADAMATTAGSRALLGIAAPKEDAEVARRLRAAGLVIVGKTNLSEWANLRSTRSVTGWSGRGGLTKNPHDLTRNACGSSSGSGAAVAAGYVDYAIGTETDGSVVCPASINGIVGLKPTIGVVSRRGIIPISASQDTAGPMTATVRQAAELLQVMAGADARDPATAAIAHHPVPDYVAGLKPEALSGVRVGVLRAFAGFHEGVDAVFEQALTDLKMAGAVVVDPVVLPHKGGYDAEELTVLLYEFKDGLNRYLATRNSAPRDLAALIAFNRREAATEMPYFQQELFEQAEAKGSLRDATYRTARAKSLRLAGAQGIDAALAKQHLDVLVAPTMGPAWVNDLVNGDHFLGGAISTPPAVAGTPHLTVPMGQVQGLPVGLSFVGPAWSEARLLAYGYAYEQISKRRVLPALATAEPH